MSGWIDIEPDNVTQPVDELWVVGELELLHPMPMTHDFKRHGTTTLFAAFDVLEGKVIGRCMQRRRHQKFIRFLNTIEARVPAGKIVHVIIDNYAAHKHPKVHQWLGRHPRFIFQPTSCSWLNAVEGFLPNLPSDD
jgi:hypothetical protein